MLRRSLSVTFRAPLTLAGGAFVHVPNPSPNFGQDRNVVLL